jgi:hypothetical protein
MNPRRHHCPHTRSQQDVPLRRAELHGDERAEQRDPESPPDTHHGRGKLRGADRDNGVRIANIRLRA